MAVLPLSRNTPNIAFPCKMTPSFFKEFVLNIKILTQPLMQNYGAFLQNFALQKILQSLGNNVETVDFIPPRRSVIRLFMSWAKTFVFRLFQIKRRSFARFAKPKRLVNFEQFASKYLTLSSEIHKYSRSILKKNTDVIIVGSDQVWRPEYNLNIYDMYLRFAKKSKIRRIAYAASFGVDNWEYSPEQTKICSALAKKFAAISVREESGVRLCKDCLDVDASWVLDPTLLLSKEDYCEICKGVPVSEDRILVVYLLDANEAVLDYCEKVSKERGLSLKLFTAGENSTLTVSEWLAMFRDASYVVTDSFHGTVFSIIFEKEFKCFYNQSRGSARFDSLLKIYNSGKLDEMREFSLNWLRNALEC